MDDLKEMKNQIGIILLRKLMDVSLMTRFNRANTHPEEIDENNHSQQGEINLIQPRS